MTRLTERSLDSAPVNFNGKNMPFNKLDERKKYDLVELDDNNQTIYSAAGITKEKVRIRLLQIRRANDFSFEELSQYSRSRIYLNEGRV